MKRTIALAAVPLLALTLVGCSDIADLAHRESAADFDDAAALRADWAGADRVAAWLPDDAVDLHLRESTAGDPAVLGFTSATGPDAAVCVETERLSIPVFVDEWTPDDDDIIKADTVFTCGDWVMAEFDGAWLAWTPSAPGEREAAPTAP